VQCDLKSGTRGLHVTFSSRIAQDQSSKSLNEIHAWFDRKVGGNNLEDMFYSLDSLSRRRKKKDSTEQRKRKQKKKQLERKKKRKERREKSRRH
jgi:DNA primase catalytic subunit